MHNSRKILLILFSLTTTSCGRYENPFAEFLPYNQTSANLGSKRYPAKNEEHVLLPAAKVEDPFDHYQDYITPLTIDNSNEINESEEIIDLEELNSEVTQLNAEVAIDETGDKVAIMKLEETEALQVEPKKEKKPNFLSRLFNFGKTAKSTTETPHNLESVNQVDFVELAPGETVAIEWKNPDAIDLKLDNITGPANDAAVQEITFDLTEKQPIEVNISESAPATSEPVVNNIDNAPKKKQPFKNLSQQKAKNASASKSNDSLDLDISIDDILNASNTNESIGKAKMIGNSRYTHRHKVNREVAMMRSN